MLQTALQIHQEEGEAAVRTWFSALSEEDQARVRSEATEAVEQITAMWSAFHAQVEMATEELVAGLTPVFSEFERLLEFR